MLVADVVRRMPDLSVLCRDDDFMTDQNTRGIFIFLLGSFEKMKTPLSSASKAIDFDYSHQSVFYMVVYWLSSLE